MKFDVYEAALSSIFAVSFCASVASSNPATLIASIAIALKVCAFASFCVTY